MISKWIQLRDTTSTTHISFKISPMSLSSTNKYHPHQHKTIEVKRGEHSIWFSTSVVDFNQTKSINSLTSPTATRIISMLCIPADPPSVPLATWTRTFATILIAL